MADAPVPADLVNDYDAWLNHGVAKGWIAQPDCIHHGSTDPIPYTEEETRRMEEGDDPCIVAARVWGWEGRPDA
jgi:hypothetical protein